MTKFNKADFNYSGGYLTYKGQFVARFKHVASNKAGFLSFLIKHFTVEEYFASYALGNAPVTILEAKGYIPAHIKRWLKDGTLKEWNPRIELKVA